jgi:hypothetical protein
MTIKQWRSAIPFKVQSSVVFLLGKVRLTPEQIIFVFKRCFAANHLYFKGIFFVLYRTA